MTWELETLRGELTRLRFDPSEKRDYHGRWTKGGGWKPSMSVSEADAWSAGSAVQGPLYHATSARNAGKIRRGGFDLEVQRKRSWDNFGQLWGGGAYLSLDQETAGLYAADRTQLELRANVKNPLVVDTAQRGHIDEAQFVAKLIGPDALEQWREAARRDRRAWKALQEKAKSLYPEPEMPPRDGSYDSKAWEDWGKLSRSRSDKRDNYIKKHWTPLQITLLPKLLKDAGYDSILIHDAKLKQELRDQRKYGGWGGSGGNQLVVLDPRDVTVVQ